MTIIAALLSSVMDFPVASPPPGQQSDFNAPSPFVLHFTITNTIFITLAGVSVLLRLYTRAFIVRYVGPEDYLILIALPFAIMAITSAQMMTDHGLGRHAWDVPVRDMVDYNKLFIVSYAGYGVSMLLVKLSLLLLYRRIFDRSVSHYSFMVYWGVVLTVVVIYGVSSILVGIFTCIPIAAAWDESITNRRCINGGAFQVSIGVLNAVTDLAILALPMFIVYKLALDKKQKMIVSALFCLGSFTCVVSLYRVSTSVKILRSGGYDFTYKLGIATLWGNIEMCCGILCACLSTLRPLIQSCFGSIFTSSKISRTGDYRGIVDGKSSTATARRHDSRLGGRTHPATTSTHKLRIEGDEIRLNHIEATGGIDRDSESGCGPTETDQEVVVTTTISMSSEKAER